MEAFGDVGGEYRGVYLNYRAKPPAVVTKAWGQLEKKEGFIPQTLKEMGTEVF